MMESWSAAALPQQALRQELAWTTSNNSVRASFLERTRPENHFADKLEKGGGSNGLKKASSSAEALSSTLIPVFVIAVAQLVAFFFLRRTERHLYAPRTFLATLDEIERTPPSQKHGWFDWIPDFLRLRDESLLEKQSLDAFLFLRFLKMVMLICFVGLALTWPILFPVNITGGGKSKELARLTIGNVKDPDRYYAHLVVACIFLTFVMFTITRETLYYINLRQAYLLSPWNASRISSRTVLFTSVPQSSLNEEYLRKVFENVKRIWTVPKHSSIKSQNDNQADLINSIENAATKTSQNAVKKNKPKSFFSTISNTHDQVGRPTVRDHWLLGQKRDAIEVYTQDLKEVQEEINKSQDAGTNGEDAETGAVFIEFNNIAAAHVAFQATAHQAPLVMVPSAIATQPTAVVWDNIGIPAWKAIIRGIAATAFVAALILFWSIPTSFIGVLSNVGDLADNVKWLRWINDLPPSVLGAIEGLLPSLLLSTLVSYVPVIFRSVARLSGEVTISEVELKTQKWYFIFQVIQVFLVTTFASGATAVTSDIINDPKSAPELLAKKLPKASNFYLSYFIIYGFGQSTKNLMNWSGLFFDKIFLFWDRTPREKYERYTSLNGTGWGSWYPKFTNLAIIAISFSVIAPLTLGFATVAFSFLYLVFRYNLFYVLRTSIDTQGRAYANALQHLTVGVYTTELCLIGLFSISSRRRDGSSGPLILIVLFTIITIIYHRIMAKELNVLTKTLPNNIIRETEQYADEEAGEGDSLLHEGSHGAPHGLRGLFVKFFEPHKYASFTAHRLALSKTRLGEAAPKIPEEKETAAYQHPSLSKKQPKIWLAKDDEGTSKKLLEELSKDFDVDDTGAWVDGNGTVKFDKTNLRDLPVWKEKLYF